jgi:hypothetical protein
MLLRRTLGAAVSARMASAAAAAPGAYAIDKDSFRQVLKVPALRVPKQKCNDFMKRLRG